jgi:D-beta-D-heptose 7-phosphate kinase/D-beta-D-heptose 1-phosphate adenosyltransferase
VRPDIYIKGAEYATRPFAERAVVEGYGGKVVLVELEPGRSTTDLIEQIAERFGNAN